MNRANDGAAGENFVQTPGVNKLDYISVPRHGAMVNWNRLWSLLSQRGWTDSLDSTEYRKRTTELINRQILLIDGEAAINLPGSRDVADLNYTRALELCRSNAARELFRFLPEFADVFYQ